MNILNSIACARHLDTGHHIHFLRDGNVQSMSLLELNRQATVLALNLFQRGVRRGDRIGVLAKNCIEWVLLDLATIKLGGVLAGFEVGRYAPDILLDKYALKLLLVDENPQANLKMVDTATLRIWAEDDASVSLPLHDGYQESDIAAIKFTSGSTGDPKGLEATVGSINDSISAVQEMFQHGVSDNIMVFLPLSLLQQRYWIYSALVFGHDVSLTTLNYVFPLAQSVCPTVIMGVPGFFDAVRTQIDRMNKLPAEALEGRREAILSLLGGKIRYLWTGSAPCSRLTLDFFNDCGIALFEGYGMNETCIVTKNYPNAHRRGSVGKVLPNKRVRFDENGMLIVGSRHPVNTHYSWCASGDNEKMFLPSGEVQTGDLGYLDADGYLYILGRADDVVALSTGRNITVRPIEECIKAHAGVHDCVLYGSGKSFLTAVVSPATADVDRASIELHILSLNQTLPSENQIRGVMISPESFSIENNLLTSQFKPKRKEIFSRFAIEIENIYKN
ncbi:long-chain acyl-CoA synthetase [Oxalobacteraceae bacterium GrIS 1.11]